MKEHNLQKHFVMLPKQHAPPGIVYIQRIFIHSFTVKKECLSFGTTGLYTLECMSMIPIRTCGAAREDTEHCLLQCPQFSALRQHFFDGVSDVGNDLC